jgi:predicted nucleotidyltransferase
LSVDLPPEVTLLLDDLVSRITDALGDNLVGVYLGGSLALGGFEPQTSDVDVLVVTERPLSATDMTRLAALHERLPTAHNEFAQEYEVYYLDRVSIRRFAPGQQHVKVGPDEPLHWAEHRPSWVLERWTARECGIALAGPDLKTLIDPVSPEDLRSAAAGELRVRLRHWSDGSWPRRELSHLGVQAYEVETACRALFTIETGEMSSKRDAVGWAVLTLPERWHPLIACSQSCRRDWTRNETRIPDVLDFLRWAIAEVGTDVDAG